MARVPAGTAARKRAPAKPKTAPAATAPAAVATIPSAEIKRMIEAGWSPSEDGLLWFHQRKSRGDFLEFSEAVAREAQASAPIPDPVPEVDPGALGVDVASPEATLPAEVLGLPDRNPLIYEEGAETDTGREVQRPAEPGPDFQRRAEHAQHAPSSAYARDGSVQVAQTAEQLAQQADAEAREAAIERNEEKAATEFAHDAVGDVVLWSCYHCNVQVRYAPHCTCRRCQLIRVESNTTRRCPFCNAANPQADS